MKAFCVALGLVVAGCLCAGMIDTNEYTKETHKVTVRQGEGIDHIASRYYELDDRKVVWDEFRTEQWAINKKNLNPGDIVIIEVSKRVQK